LTIRFRSPAPARVVAGRCRFGALAALCLAAGAWAQPWQLPDFDRQVLDAEFEGGYGVDFADGDGDGRPDILARATNPGQIAWYRNPDWGKHPVATALRGIVDSAPHDIDEIPTSHRVLWADVNGDGKPELVNLPIIGVGAEAPLYDASLQLKSYPVPEDLAASSWNGVVLDHSLELSHAMASLDWDGDGRDDLLTASLGGVYLFQLAVNGRAVAKTQIGPGAPESDTAAQDGGRPQLGSSGFGAGALPGGRRFVAAIEAWHGNQVVVYQGDELPMNRVAIDNGIAGGHGLATADLNNDGVDEIIAGGRAEPYRLAVYRYDEDSGRWRRRSVERETALSGLAATDVDGDGDIDLAAIGSTTRTLVLYRNRGS